MKRIIFFACVIATTTSLSGCGWYMRQADEIGSHMPTYDGWFGDKPAPAPQQNQSYNYYDNSQQGMALNQAPQEQRMGISGNPAGSYQPQQPPYGYAQTQPQGYPPFPPPPQGGFPPPPVNQLPPPQAGEMPPPPPGFNNSSPQRGGPDPMEGLRQLQMQQQQGVQQPFVPFTEPVLENSPEPQQQVEPMAATITEEAPKERGTFSFLSDIGDVISGWFESESKKEFPNLASVPDAPQYDKKMQEAESAREELEADKESAQAQQKEITDWSDLAESDAPVTALSSITSPTGNEVVVAPETQEIVMPEPKAPETVVVMPEETPKMVVTEAPKIVVNAPAPIVIHEQAEPMGTKVEYLRKPEPFTTLKLLPRNRYAGRR